MIDWRWVDHHERALAEYIKAQVPGFGDDRTDKVEVYRDAMDTYVVVVRFKGEWFKDAYRMGARLSAAELLPSPDTINRMLLLA